MYCTKCGVQIGDENARFCSQCGAATGRGTPRPATVNRLSRPNDDKKIAGVCSGFARYLGADVTLIRILVVILTLWSMGFGLLAYIICWIVMPRDPDYLPQAQPQHSTG